jgi:hypothetical protein
MWETGIFEMQIEGQETSEKMGCLPLFNVVTPHLHCMFHQPSKIFLFLLTAIEFPFDLFWLHKISQKVQSLDNQQ